MSRSGDGRRRCGSVQPVTAGLAILKGLTWAQEDRMVWYDGWADQPRCCVLGLMGAGLGWEGMDVMTGRDLTFSLSEQPELNQPTTRLDANGQPWDYRLYERISDAHDVLTAREIAAVLLTCGTWADVWQRLGTGA